MLFSLICLGVINLTLALFAKRKIWPLSLKIASSLFKAVFSILQLTWRIFPFGCIAVLLEEAFIIHHTFHLEMAHLNNPQYGKAMNFTQKYTCALVTLSVLHLKAMLYTQFLLFFQYCTEKKISVHCCRNVRKITIDTPTSYNGVCEQVTT